MQIVFSPEIYLWYLSLLNQPRISSTVVHGTGTCYTIARCVYRFIFINIIIICKRIQFACHLGWMKNENDVEIFSIVFVRNKSKNSKLRFFMFEEWSIGFWFLTINHDNKSVVHIWNIEWIERENMNSNVLLLVEAPSVVHKDWQTGKAQDTKLHSKLQLTAKKQKTPNRKLFW